VAEQGYLAPLDHGAGSSCRSLYALALVFPPKLSSRTPGAPVDQRRACAGADLPPADHAAGRHARHGRQRDLKEIYLKLKRIGVKSADEVKEAYLK
jgi:hypothetical protein